MPNHATVSLRPATPPGSRRRAVFAPRGPCGPEAPPTLGQARCPTTARDPTHRMPSASECRQARAAVAGPQPPGARPRRGCSGAAEPPRRRAGPGGAACPACPARRPARRPAAACGCMAFLNVSNCEHRDRRCAPRPCAGKPRALRAGAPCAVLRAPCEGAASLTLSRVCTSSSSLTPRALEMTRGGRTPTHRSCSGRKSLAYIFNSLSTFHTSRGLGRPGPRPGPSFVNCCVPVTCTG